jgi:hypothetical protein
MLKSVDRACAVVLGLGAGVGHTLGSLMTYGHQPEPLLWALNTSVLGVLLAALHLLRSFRPADRMLAGVLAPATLAWLISTATFGGIIGNALDPRVLVFEVVSVALIAFSLNTALRGGSAERASR